MPNAKIVSRRKVPPLNRSKKPNTVPWFWLDEILEALGVDAGDRQVTAEAVHRQHRQREQDALPKIRDPKDVRKGF